tara:strand:- start:126 stop:587 length:462 start_codon:yes stop_codon:yes gene_type:complete
MFLTKYINKLLIFSLIIITFYNIFSIFILLSNYKIDSYFTKFFNYLPYNHSIFFEKPFSYSKNLLQSNNQTSKKLYYLLGTTEKKSALDYSYWNNKLLYQISHNIDLNDFEKNFQNSVILSKNNLNLKKSLKLFYLRNIPRFSKETRDIVMSN